MTNKHTTSSCKVFAASLLLVFGLVSGSTVYSATIVDTGPGPSPFPGNAWVFTGSEVFAGQFSLLESSTVTSAEGWFGINGLGSGFDFNIRIYDQASNGLPGSVLFSGSVFAPPPSVPAGETYGFGWYGLSNIHWDLAAGTYWISFEDVDPTQPDALMPGPSKNPLVHYARNDVLSGNVWGNADWLDLGVRIEGNPVPIPASFWLLISGLASLIFSKRRQSGTDHG